MHRWRKPPIFAFAYISPARSSKRRITSIVSRTVRQVSLSGRSCLTFPNPISSRPATSLGDRPSLPGSSLPWAPSPACVTSLVAIGSESTHCRLRSITLTPVWGALLRRPGGPSPRRSLTPASDPRGHLGAEPRGEAHTHPGGDAEPEILSALLGPRTAPHPREATPRPGRKPPLRGGRRPRTAGPRRRSWERRERRARRPL